ncbi:cytoplasmic protein [Candidatus Parcubacteria bacterium]|nr:MAG: cytoplasmic protein [Candidatus Parcubacteria bacterium]
MKNTQQLINNIKGKLNGISKMIDEDKDCKAVITQLKAVKSATGSLMQKYIEDNTLSCLGRKGSVKIKDKEQIKDLIKELIKNN